MYSKYAEYATAITAILVSPPGTGRRPGAGEGNVALSRVSGKTRGEASRPETRDIPETSPVPMAAPLSRIGVQVDYSRAIIPFVPIGAI